MELKLKGGGNVVSLRRGYELLKGGSNGGLGVVSCREEEGGVVRMKIVVRKSDLKQLVEVMKGVKGIAHNSTMLSSSSSSVEQRLNKLMWKKYLSKAKSMNENGHKCWSPVLQSIPEEL
ncbi:hypothetical protein VNO77_11985 [Canavalia gladiata]|uniref:Uncharacterized protein n=1 Tax=Canavalia gladiata TaxID=3824 RepID=A0AAN9M122_CANGL